MMQNINNTPPLPSFEALCKVGEVAGKTTINLASEVCKATFGDNIYQQISHQTQAALKWRETSFKAFGLPQSAFDALIATTVGCAALALSLSNPRAAAVGVIGITACGLYAFSKAQKSMTEIIQKADMEIQHIFKNDEEERATHQRQAEMQRQKEKEKERIASQEVAASIHQGLYGLFGLFAAAITPTKKS